MQLSVPLASSRAHTSFAHALVRSRRRSVGVLLRELVSMFAVLNVSRPRVLSVSVQHVAHVVGVSADQKMLRVHTEPHVASVAHNQPIRDRSFSLLVGVTVREDGLTTTKDEAVAMSSYMPSPELALHGARVSEPGVQ